MPIFKSTYNILVKPDEDEVFNPNWFDTPFLQLPPSCPWTYEREMQIEDVDIWEVLVEHGGGLGVYAAWCPYAEFYLVTTGTDLRTQKVDEKTSVNYNSMFYETYYGAGAQEKVKQKANQLGLPLCESQLWVEPEDMWLYQPKEIVDLIL